MDEESILTKAHCLNFPTGWQGQHDGTYMLRQIRDRRMFKGTRTSQAIRTEAILVGFDVQLNLATQKADAHTGTHSSGSDEAYSQLRGFGKDVG